MMAQLIDGKLCAQTLRAEIKKEVTSLRENTGKVPGLAVVLVGEDPASQVYVANKAKACEEVGIYSEVILKSALISEQELLDIVAGLNARSDIHGILVQLPLPKHIEEKKVIDTIVPEKDVDGFHPLNMGQLLLGQPRFISCTPYGCLYLIKSLGIDLTGKHAVVVGRSNIVGKPMAALLLKENATVTICHSRTKDLGEITRQADILVVAIGKAQFVTQEMVKPGAVVIDVGMNRLSSGKLVGDVDFTGVSAVAGWITPVPGGVGPMTITMLLKNTLEAFKQ